MTEGGGVPVIRYDLARYTVVQSVVAPNVFITDSVGYGAGSFIGYSAYVMRKGTGTGGAPQTESQLVNGYVPATGQVTVAGGYTVLIAAGDELLLLHPSLANAAAGGQIPLLHGQTPVKGTTTANWNTAEQTVVTIGAAGVRYKVQSVIIDVTGTSGNITLRMYINVNGNLRKVFPPKAGTTFSVSGGDSPGIAIINGTYGIANALLVTAQSDNVLDNGVALGYEYFLEAM